MFFIHGGNFVYLSGGSLLFNGEDFVSKGQVILVNVDYRLGAFGFLYTGDRKEDAKGNYGIKDQRLALQWVQDNIGNFGGDPKKVTVFGQSAGAQSTAIHLANGKADGLFHNAIIESSPFDIRYKTKDEALFLGVVIAESVNCMGGDMACLRSKPAADLAVAEHEARSFVTSPFLLEFFEPIGPWVDGDEVKMEPIESAHRGQFQNIPILMGTVSEETRIYVYESFRKPLSLEAYVGIVLLTEPRKTRQIIEKYPIKHFRDCRDTLVKLSTDLIFTCTARNVSRSLQKFHRAPIYLYIFNHAISFKGGWSNFTFCENHVCHGSELPFLFHTSHLAGFHLSAEEERLSTELISYCPIAPLIYIIQAEAMSSAIRVDPHIQGIQLPSHGPNKVETKISQFVDDTQLFCKNEQSLPFIFRNLRLYEEASGAKMNKSKTTGLMIGKLKNKTPNFKDVNWTKDYVKTLGICHGYNVDLKHLYTTLVTKIKRSLNNWSLRNLTLRGKILVVNTFVISKLLFMLEVKNIPTEFITEIEKLIKNFVWDNKQPLINKETCNLGRELGGLGLPNIESISKSLNIRTIYRIIHSEPQNWNLIGKYYLQSLDNCFGQDYFICLCSSLKGLSSQLKFKSDPFYYRAITDWMEFRKKLVQFKASKENILLGNHFITARNKPLFIKSFAKSNILTIDDIWDKEKDTFQMDQDIFRRLIDKRNWISELSTIKRAVRDFLKRDLNSPEQTMLSIGKLKLYNGKNEHISYFDLKLRDIQNVFTPKQRD